MASLIAPFWRLLLVRPYVAARWFFDWRPCTNRSVCISSLVPRRVGLDPQALFFVECTCTCVGDFGYRSLIQFSPFHTQRLGDCLICRDVSRRDIARPAYRRASQRRFLESEPALPVLVRSNQSLEPTAGRQQKFHMTTSTRIFLANRIVAGGGSACSR